MKWSVALFGHEKPRFYVQDENTGKTVHSFIEHPGPMPDGLKLHHVTGWEKRAEPGDFIEALPVDHPWTPNERSAFLIIEIEGPEDYQIQGLKEAQFDLNSYPKFEPSEYNDFIFQLVEDTKKAKDQKKALENLNKQDKQKLYEKYINDWKEYCAYPKDYIKKRRFGITLNDLSTIGVDVEQMLDRNILYSPKIKVEHEALFDKHKKRNVLKSDSLNLIQPIEVI